MGGVLTFLGSMLNFLRPIPILRLRWRVLLGGGNKWRGGSKIGQGGPGGV